MVIRSEPLAAPANLSHGFLTRRGGVSLGLYRSLNCGRAGGDDPGRVAENRRRALAAAADDAASLCLARQVHGARALVVESGWPARAAPRADALVTARPGLALGVTSADCAPVLVADPEAGIVAAAHAGWRGALAGIVEATVAAMSGIGAAPARMIAAIGPCIAQDSYEVGAAFAASFLAQDRRNRRFFAAGGDGDAARLRFDLPAYVRSRAIAAGIATVDVLGLDTCADERRFFSHRRARLRGEPGHGLGISIVALRR